MGIFSLTQELAIDLGTANTLIIYNGKVVVGFAGSVADAFALSEKFEEKLTQFSGNLPRAAVELAQDWRMDKAMSLLTGTEMKTVQIAQEVGIPDPSYFSYSFKKSFGISPSQARKREGATL